MLPTVPLAAPAAALPSPRRRRRRSFLRWIPGGMILLAALVGCGEAVPGDEDERLRVVATVGMITDIAERVGGDRVRVHGLMGPGVDPHLYKASAGDIRRLAGADLILYNGLHLEAAMADLLEQMDGRTRTRAVTADIDPARLLRPAEFEGAYDPHVWSDVSLWMVAVGTVVEVLSELDPEGEGDFRANADLLLEELEELDRWIQAQVARVPEHLRVLVTAHDAFNYFGRAYGFEVRGLQGLSTVAEAGAGDVQDLAGFIVRREIPALFVESSIPTRNVEAVQAAVRARGFEVAMGGTLFSDAMGDAGTPEGTYPGMIRHNVRTIVEALAPDVEEEP